MQIKKFGLSLINSSPKEIMYFQIENIKFHREKLNNTIEMKFSLSDIQVKHLFNKIIKYLYFIL